MDPTEWPMIIKLLAGWGPLGVWAFLAERRAHRAVRDHHATHAAHEKAITAIEERHRKAAVEKDEAQRKQLEQVTDRMIRLVENQSRQAHRLADGVTERIRRSKEEET